MTNGLDNSRDKELHHAPDNPTPEQGSEPERDRQRRFLEWLSALTNLAIVSGLVVAVVQLRQSNQEAKISYTLDFVHHLETRDFEDTYRRAIDWFGEHPEAVEWPPSDQLAGDINHVLNRYSSLAAFYNRDVLDRTVIDTTVGLQVPKFYRASESLLEAKDVPGYDQLAAFCVTMERIARETE